MSLNRKVKDMDTKELRMSELDASTLPSGFINEETLDQINDLNRLTQVLVRCGGGRFVCAAQDAKHFIDIISKDNSDYVRDVSVVPQGSDRY